MQFSEEILFVIDGGKGLIKALKEKIGKGLTYQKEELLKFEKWLERINPSAPLSLKECAGELLMVHKLNVPPLLRKTLYSTNPIESMFSEVSRNMGRVTSMKKVKMGQLWFKTALLNAEKKFRKVKVFLQITEMRDKIKSLQKEDGVSGK